MGTDRCCTIILSVWLSIYFLLGSSAMELGLPPPTNFTFGMDGMFCLLLQWNPSENTANCSIRYTKSIFSKNKQTHQGRGKQPNYAANIKSVDLNEKIIFTVQAECNDTHIMSKNISLARQMATGDPNTSVRNLRCIWHHLEYVQCTWQPGHDVPPDVNYTLIYWTSEETLCKEVDISHSKQFHDLLPTGSPCHNYTFSNGISNGCQFKFQKPFATVSKLLIAVSDWSKKVKPYLYHVSANDIAKLKPPVIKTAYRTSNDIINITWSDMEVHTELLHEVLVEMSNRKTPDSYKDFIGLSKEIPNALSDVTYTVKVRVRLSQFAREDGHIIWSDWSEQWTLQGANSGSDPTILLLLLITTIFIVAAVILLVFMRRLKIIIFPQIPDPGKVLSSDLQQWLKNGRFAYSEPRKEEICPISLLETPVTSSLVE